MKKFGRVLCFAMLVCLVSFLSFGCSKKEEKTGSETETTKTGQEKTEDESSSEEKTENDTSEEASSEEKTEKNTSSTQSDTQSRKVTVYFVDEASAEVIGEGYKISDEYDIWEILQKKGILTDECRLLSLKVNESEKKIDLDFNTGTGDRIRSIGTTGETEIVGCIVNTYLEAYDCNKIKLTENGQSFETSHGADFTNYTGRISFGE